MPSLSVTCAVLLSSAPPTPLDREAGLRRAQLPSMGVNKSNINTRWIILYDVEACRTRGGMLLGSGVCAALISQLILLMLQNLILAQSSKTAHSCSTKGESVIFYAESHTVQ